MTGSDNALLAGLAGSYVIQRELGRGGMATVYLAHDLKHDRPVALKVLHPELANTLGPERFLREIRLTARLDHPHILPVLDSGVTAGQLWYIMPFVEGESLRGRLNREVQLSVEQAALIAREVADALDCAHQQGVVHRDIKPENILLARGHARVTDFGVARALQAAGEGRLTETGMAVGTPAYMSPEQGAGDAHADGRSDLYSLGCVLYEMLAGEPPFTGPTPQAVLAKRFAGPAPSVRVTRPDVPPELESVLARAMAQVPAARFATARDLVRALDQIQVTGASVRQGSEIRRSKFRPLRYLTLGAIALALALGGVVLARTLATDGNGTDDGPKRLAVLPLKNMGAPEDQYFADGLTEEITSRLSGVSNLSVISRTSADQYKNTAKPLKQIGRELGVHYVLEGSVRWEKRPSGTSRVRVTPQLIQVSDDSHLWTDRYEADLAEVFSVQTKIAEQVTHALGVALAPSEREVLAAKEYSSSCRYGRLTRVDQVRCHYHRDKYLGLIGDA